MFSCSPNDDAESVTLAIDKHEFARSLRLLLIRAWLSDQRFEFERNMRSIFEAELRAFLDQKLPPISSSGDLEILGQLARYLENGGPSPERG